MKITSTRIADVKLIEPKVFSDERGFFMEAWNERAFREAGINAAFVQDNHSRSVRGVLRGLHYQVQQPQGKLVRVTAGEIFDVAVDIRQQSATFGQWVGVTLSADNHRMLWIPPGFAHGFCVVSEWADVLYKCTDFYAADDQRSLIWSDPQLAINWPITDPEDLILSDQDRAGHPLTSV